VTAAHSRVSFGIKTSQSGLTYDEILKTWLEADEVPVFEHAWLWDHEPGRCFRRSPPGPRACGSV